ncbi:MAG TPA: helix-turn-helix domain-containing protein [Pyrinomonadaceae bacterium]
MMETAEKRLLTEQQAADYFGWSIYTMREIRKRGEIECVRFNERTVRYTLEQLEDYKHRHMSRVDEGD